MAYVIHPEQWIDLQEFQSVLLVYRETDTSASLFSARSAVSLLQDCILKSHLTGIQGVMVSYYGLSSFGRQKPDCTPSRSAPSVCLKVHDIELLHRSIQTHRTVQCIL